MSCNIGIILYDEWIAFKKAPGIKHNDSVFLFKVLEERPANILAYVG